MTERDTEFLAITEEEIFSEARDRLKICIDAESDNRQLAKEDMLFREGSGPMGELLLKEGTGPVVDTPFFAGGAMARVHTKSDLPFASSRSSLSDLAIPPPRATAPAPEVTSTGAPEPTASPVADALPDWLRTEASGTPAAPAPTEPGTWTGALDHLMPSKLVIGLTRALLARGLVTEEEILAALGQKK